MRRVIGVSAGVAAVLLLAACGGGGGPAAAGAQPPAVSAAGQCEGPAWDALVTAAKQEGRVVVAGPAATRVREELPKAFRDEFGITVDYAGASAVEQASKLAAEYQGGLRQQDVMISTAGPTFSQLLRLNLLGDLRSVLVGDQILKPEVWRTGEVPFIDPEKTKALALADFRSDWIVVNTDKVNPADIKSWDDLLDPKYKGKIVTDDPSGVGPGTYPAAMLLEAKGEDFLKRLYVDQDPLVINDFRAEVDAVARGTHPIGVALVTALVDQAIEDGFPLEVIRPTGGLVTTTSGISVVGITASPAHPKAAALMVNWLACKQGSEVFLGASGVTSARVDVQTGNPQRWKQDVQPGEQLFKTNTYEYFTTIGPKAKAVMQKLLAN